MDQRVYRAETDEDRARLARLSENADRAASDDRLNGFLARAMQQEALARAMRLIGETKGGITVSGLRRLLITEFRLAPDKLDAVMNVVYRRTKGIAGPHKDKAA